MLKSSDIVVPFVVPHREKVSWGALLQNDWVISGFLVLVATIPTVALWRHSAYLTGDSYQYLRAALSFASGQGLKDMSGDAFTFYPPVYPLLVGAVHKLAPSLNLETTARLLSLAGASIAVLSLYHLVGARYPRSIAVSTSLLFALLPLRAWSGLWALSEGLYLGLLMLALLTFFRLGLVSHLGALLGGILFGLAYLTRSESIVYIAVIGIVTVISALKGQRHRVWSLTALSAGFLAVVVPYHAWVYHVTGAATSGRLGLNLAQSESFYQGQGPQFVYLHQVNESGISVQQRTTNNSLQAISSRYAFFVLTEIRRVVYNLGPHRIVLGLFLIGIIFLASKPSSFTNGIEFPDLWQLVLPSTLLVLPFFHIEDRYLLPVMPALLLWLVLIVARIGSLTAARFSAHAKLFVNLIPIAFVALFALSYGYRLATQTSKTDATLQARHTAGWIQSQELPAGLVMSQNPDLAFFADRIHVWMPAGESENVLRYAQSSGARFIYVSSGDVPTPLNNLLLGDLTLVPGSLQLLHEEFDGSMKARLFSVEEEPASRERSRL